jgi:hypothetical protein
MTLELLAGRLSVCRLDHAAQIDPLLLAPDRGFVCVARTPRETSVVCPEGLEPPGSIVEAGFRAFEVEGPIPFGVTGIVSSITSPLAAAGISVFTISTYDTDYVLVKEVRVQETISALRAEGFDLI